VKILEARLVQPLRNYMVRRLHRSQTGFVPGMSPQVNCIRFWLRKKLYLILKYNFWKPLFSDINQTWKEIRPPKYRVAQGSIISPYLFNIYAEGLLDELEIAGWKLRDLYGFADDHLILNGSPSQFGKTIDMIRNWSLRFNIELNPSKSGILEVPPKFGTSMSEINSHFRVILNTTGPMTT